MTRRFDVGVRNAKKEELGRLESKTLDARFLRTIHEGLGCSPLEAEAVLGVGREVYMPFPDGGDPGGAPAVFERTRSAFRRTVSRSIPSVRVIHR